MGLEQPKYSLTGKERKAFKDDPGKLAEQERRMAEAEERAKMEAEDKGETRNNFIAEFELEEIFEELRKKNGNKITQFENKKYIDEVIDKLMKLNDAKTGLDENDKEIWKREVKRKAEEMIRKKVNEKV